MFNMLEGWVAWYHNDAGQLIPHPLNEGVPTWFQEYKSGHASGPAPAATGPGKGSELVSPTGAGSQDGSTPPVSLPDHSEDKPALPASGPVGGTSTSAEASSSRDLVLPPASAPRPPPGGGLEDGLVPPVRHPSSSEVKPDFRPSARRRHQ